jgi:uncharacterized circularly permuted ATP-grasp superfamily protein/uncharacterized alpha-E superfamily protein
MQEVTPPPASPFSVRYRSTAGRWDEFVDEAGQVRPPARTLTDFLDGLGVAGLRQRAEQVRQLVRDHGVSYSAPGDRQAGERAWNLDPIPSLLAASEFAELATGLAQRARLLEMVLADLYGPQRLLREGLLPARLVLGNPTFLRPCHGLGLARHIHLYAADVVRTSAGSFRALRDRTQAPTGAGYALENRLVMSQALEEPFRKSNVERLAPFFRTLRETLASLVPVARENPHIVLQSSGAWSPTYFEQAFLAQYLGYPLVEGGDLTVRDRRVFLKTLGGLSPVDVIFRQPEDDYCDPLELRPDSSLGVPGLIEAVRAGHVAVANALGAGLLQSPAFLPFLPKMARMFLGEDLRLDSAPSFWCGEPAALSHVEAHLDGMMIRPAWPGSGPSLAVGEQLRGEARAAFLSRLRASPETFVAQEHLVPACAPVLAGTELVPRSFVLRGYAVVAGEDYLVMPGGLSLAAADACDPVIAAVQGALAKDLWVRSDGPVGHFSLLPPATLSVELSRGGADLPSRSADNLFWLGRYAERAEAMARLARHLLGRLADVGDAGIASSLSPALPSLFEVLATATESEPLTSAPPMAWLARALCSSAPAGSLHNTLRAAVRSAAAVRDRLSADTFRVLGALGDETLRAEGLAEHHSLGTLTAFLDRVISSLSALSGLAMESMTRGHGWRFLDMGRRLERALQLLSLLRAAFASGAESDGALLETLLAVADSSITYRRRYLAGLHPAAVVDLLLVDDSNPRAVLFQIAALRDHLLYLPREATQARLRPEERLALGALTRLQLLDVIPVCQPRSDGKRPAIHAILGEIEADLTLLSEQLCGGYLNHALMARPLAEDPGKGSVG